MAGTGLATVFVLGAGNFGTSLSAHLGKLGHEVLLWDRAREIVQAIAETGRNSRYLSDLQLPATVTATTQLEDVTRAELLLLAVPSHALREVLGRLQSLLAPQQLIVGTAKGLELESGLFPRQIVGDVLGEDYAAAMAVLSGPSFARELADGQPTCVSAAGYDRARLLRTQEIFHAPHLRVYTADDPMGLEVAGAFKNVIAIAVGACAGLGYGANSRAALTTRGLAEMMRLGHTLGANPLTFNGLGGVGDLFLTCSSPQSRNYSLGHHLGRGLSPRAAQRQIKSVAEGILTSKALHFLAQKQGVSTPIVDEVYYVLYHDKPIGAAVNDLISRDARPERDDFHRKYAASP